MQECPNCEKPAKVVHKDYAVIKPIRQRYIIPNAKHKELNKRWGDK